jgi:hypothetical protein
VKEDNVVADVPINEAAPDGSIVEEEEAAPDGSIVAEEEAAPDGSIVEEEEAAPDATIFEEDKVEADGSIVAEEEVPCLVCHQLPGTIIDFSKWVNQVAMHKCAGCGEIRDYFQRSSDGSSMNSYYGDEEEDNGSDLYEYR